MRLLIWIVPRRLRRWDRGELTRDADGWAFRPLTIMPIGTLSGLAVLRVMLNCRRAAAAYLKKRGLARPAVPWASLNELKSKA